MVYKMVPLRELAERHMRMSLLFFITAYNYFKMKSLIKTRVSQTL